MTENKKKRTGVVFTRPRDMSFEAYKEFVTETVNALSKLSGRKPKDEDWILSAAEEAEWRKDWKRFWAGAGKEPAKKEEIIGE